MKSTRRTILAAMLALGAGAVAQAQTPPAPPAGPAYVLTYLEFAPNAVGTAMTAMRAYRDVSRRETGARTVDIYQETGHPYRFILREIWQDRAAYDRHAMGTSRSQFETAIKPIHFGPQAVGVHVEYWMSPTKAAGAN